MKAVSASVDAVASAALAASSATAASGAPSSFDVANIGPELVAALVLAALLLFWMIGAHNRLVLLRTQLVQAWAKVDDALRQRSAAGTPLLAALHEPLAAEHGALQAWDTAMADAARAATAMGSRPVSADHAAAWVAAQTALGAATSRVFALLDQHPALQQQPAVADHAIAWRQAGSRLAFARQVFNEAAVAYNDALALFPTRLLVPLFRFGPAGLI